MECAYLYRCPLPEQLYLGCMVCPFIIWPISGWWGWYYMHSTEQNDQIYGNRISYSRSRINSINQMCILKNSKELSDVLKVAACLCHLPRHHFSPLFLTSNPKLKEIIVDSFFCRIRSNRCYKYIFVHGT